MGDLMQIHIPKCRIRDIFTSKTSVLVGVFQNRKTAQEACDQCHKMTGGKCPMSEPGIQSFAAEDDRP